MLVQEYKLKPSKQFLWLFSAASIFCLMIVVLLPISIIGKVLILTALGIYLRPILRRDVLLQGERAILGLHCSTDGQWTLEMPAHRLEAALCQDSTLTPYISVLRFRAKERFWPLSCVVFRDSLSADLYRRLQVTLNHLP